MQELISQRREEKAIYTVEWTKKSKTETRAYTINDGKTVRLMLSGALEKIVNRCCTYVAGGQTLDLDDNTREIFKGVEGTSHSIGYAYRDYDMTAWQALKVKT